MNLKNRRKVFHSEADLQFAIGWEIDKLITNSKIRFEQPFQEQSIDLVYCFNKDKIAVELKYKTSKLTVSEDDEFYNLKEHAALDIGRFDVLKDISRVESFIQSGFATKGFVLFITNCSAYWLNTTYSGSQNAHDKEFRLIQDREITGSLKWPDEAKVTTYGKKRINGLNIRGNYKVNWDDYSIFSNEKNGIFRFVLFEVS